MQQSLSYILFHSYSGGKRRRESLNEIYHSTRWKQRAPFATRPEVGKSARAATYKISIYRIFPLQWGLMSVILPRRKKSRCLRFKEDPLPKGSRAPFPTFYPRKISSTRQHSRKYHLRIRLYPGERKRGIELFIIAPLSRLSMRKLTKNLEAGNLAILL